MFSYVAREWKRHNLRNPFDIIWRMFWYPFLITAMFTACLLYAILSRSIEDGKYMWDNKFQ